MEDVDQPRSVAGADQDIVRILSTFGLQSDEPVVYQSSRTSLYCAALETLKRQGAVYPCSCSRRETVAGVCSGACRQGVRHPARPVAWRVRDDEEGDFVVLRSDGYFAYQLAVVVDDCNQGITHVVRGADLQESTPRQMRLQHLLGYPTPRYLHIPLVLNEAGEKLSKQTKAPPVDHTRPDVVLRRALRFLRQPEPPPALSAAELLAFAASEWDPGRF